jgi:hypothetical protein
VTSLIDQASDSMARCKSSGRIQFGPGLATLKQSIGDVMGEPAACPEPNYANKDIRQPTTNNGLAYIRWCSEKAVFTDGWHHWAIDQSGESFYWEGESPDPPVPDGCS